MVNCLKCVLYKGCVQRKEMEERKLRIKKCKNRKVRKK